MLAQETGVELPEFAEDAQYSLFYPTDVLEMRDDGGGIFEKITYKELPIVNKTLSMGEIGQAGSMVVDGMLGKRRIQER